MSLSAQNELISQNYCLCQQAYTFKYPEQMQIIRVRKNQTHFNKKLKALSKSFFAVTSILQDAKKVEC